MKKVFLIINPHSGKYKSQSMLFDIISTMSDYDCVVTTRITNRQGDARAFALDACTNGDYDLVVCSGGDGTLNETVDGVYTSGKAIPIGYIPSGSTNDYARSLGISSDYKEATVRCIVGEPHTLDIGKMDNRHFNYIASFGMFTSVSYSTPQSLKKLLGHMAYVMAGMKDITKIKSTHARFTYDGNVLEGDYIFGAIANTTSIGGVVHLKDNLVEFNDGLFEVCLVKMPRNPADLMKITVGALSSDFSSECFEYCKVKTAKIEFDDEIAWSLDGEKHITGSDVCVDVIPNAVTIML